MAELNNAPAAQGAGGRIRRKKLATRVDLTAMVDLAFLLITFFILTTTLQKPKAMGLIMPDNSKPTETPYPESRTMTILVGAHNKVEWYIGIPNHPLVAPTVTGFGSKGISVSLLNESNRIKRETGKDMMVIIKASDKANTET